MISGAALGRPAAALALVLAAPALQLGCGDEVTVGLLPPAAGEANVLGDGRIVLSGCPSEQPIDTRESYAIETPIGSCSAAVTSCAVQTQQWCPGGAPGPLIAWACTCTGAAWACSIREKQGACPTSPSVTPGQETKPCTYDPARYHAVACESEGAGCGIATIQTCPNGSQGKTSHWWCDCKTYPTLAPDEHVWACYKESDDGRSCGYNTCPSVTSYSVSRSSAPLGQHVELRASARDDDGDDVSYRWIPTLGRIINPTARNTSYTCSTVGRVTLTVKASDGTCEDSRQIEIDCTE